MAAECAGKGEEVVRGKFPLSSVFCYNRYIDIICPLVGHPFFLHESYGQKRR